MVARTIGLLFIGSMMLVSFAPSVVALPDRAALLDFIAKHEAPDGYDSVHASIQEVPPMPLTQMSLGEVLAWQKRIRPQAVSTAVGRYQFIHKTLARLARDHDVDPDRVFDESLQDELANRLLDDCGYGKRQLGPVCELSCQNLGGAAGGDRAGRRPVSLAWGRRQPGVGHLG